MIPWWLATGVFAVLLALIAYQRARTKNRIEELKDTVHGLNTLIVRDQWQSVAEQRGDKKSPFLRPESVLDRTLPPGVAAHDIHAASDYWLVAHLETLNPRLSAQDVSDFEKVSWLRHWVAQRIPDATYECCLDADRRHAVYELPAARILHELGVTNSGFKCAGTALVLRKICDPFGYHACTYNFGNPLGGRASHMLCLVEIQRDGEKIWCVQDPYFDHALVDRRGRPLSFQEVLANLAEGEEQNVVTDAPGESRLFLQRTTDRERIAWLERSGGEKCAEGAGRVVYRFRQSPADWMARHPEAGRYLEREAGGSEPLLLMLFSLGFSGSVRANDLKPAIEQARFRRIALAARRVLR